MTKIHSTSRGRRRKLQSAKPHPDFPLTAHPSGRWCKKIKGRLHYFGKIILNDCGASAQAALDKWLAEKDDLLVGRVPRARNQEDGVTLDELTGRFLDTKKALRDSGELSPWTWNSYHEICAQLIKHFGAHRLITDILPEDFEGLRAKWAKTYGPVRLGSEINRARVVFNYAWKNGLASMPIRFGEGFKRPSKKVMRLNRAEQGAKMFEAHELRAMIDGALQPVKSMILLAINCALGNNDVGKLRMKHLDLDGPYLNYPRPKTGIMRRCPLWPETVEALKEYFFVRPTPANEADADLVFVTTRDRRGWTADLKARPLTNEIRKLLDRLKINGRRNYYAIRHTFETIGGETRDQVAVNAVMGHDDGSTASVYRERISDERLQDVVRFVHDWLYAEPNNGKPTLKIVRAEEDGDENASVKTAC